MTLALIHYVDYIKYHGLSSSRSDSRYLNSRSKNSRCLLNSIHFFLFSFFLFFLFFF